MLSLFELGTISCSNGIFLGVCETPPSFKTILVDWVTKLFSAFDTSFLWLEFESTTGAVSLTDGVPKTPLKLIVWRAGSGERV